MIRRRWLSRGVLRRSRGEPPREERLRNRPIGAAIVGRIGAPPLIALATALSLLALLVCALSVPGFVLRAGAETTVPPVQPSPAQPVPMETAPGRAIATLPWGDGPGEVGLVRPDEGLGRGPEALAVSPDGRIAILDSVNSRLVLLGGDGSFIGTIPLTLSEPRFLAADERSLYVFDADRDRQLICLDWTGGETHSAQIPVLDDVVTGLFATDTGPCIEVAHDDVFLVEFKDNGRQATAADRATPASLHALAGRPIDRNLEKEARATFKPGQGVKLKCIKVDKKSLKALQVQTVSPALAEEGTVEHLVSLDGDGQGGLILGARLLSRQDDRSGASSLRVGRLATTSDQPDATWATTSTIALSDSAFAYFGQPYVVAPDGRILQPVGGEAGYTIMVYTLPAGSGPLPAPSAPATEEVGS